MKLMKVSLEFFVRDVNLLVFYKLFFLEKDVL